MKYATIAAITLLTVGMSAQAEAKGCIKGAIVGGIAGHYAGHGVIGAMGGCVAGRALAKRADRRDAAPPVRDVRTGNGVNPRSGSGSYVAY